VRGMLWWAGALAVLALAGAGCSSPSSSANPGVLSVTVQAAGGPPLPNGGTQIHPVSNAQVKVAAAGGPTVSAVTNSAGVASFRLSGGSYYVSVGTCGYTGKREVTVKPAGSASLTWVCPVP
jgi:hypothetical protein